MKKERIRELEAELGGILSNKEFEAAMSYHNRFAVNLRLKRVNIVIAQLHKGYLEGKPSKF